MNKRYSKRTIKVLLIQPPTTGGVRSLLPQVDGSEGIGHKPPLGILYVATYLKVYSQHEVKVLDCHVAGNNFNKAMDEVCRYKPDLVGISAWTDFWYPAYKLGKAIKKVLPDIHLTYGGPHVNIYPEVTLGIDFVDSVVVGDGEVPFYHLSNMVADRVKDNSFPGLHWSDYGVKYQDEKFYIQKDLDDLPIPDRHLLDIKNYTSVLGKGRFVTTMITSRGCPYKCTFCKLYVQKTLCRSAENVVKEFEEIQKLGIKEVEVYDDTFTWSKDRAKNICQCIQESHIDIRWAIRDRVSASDEEVLAELRKAGCDRIHYGVESGVDRVIKAMKKHITTAQAEEAVRIAKKHGFTVLTYFMFGNIEESIEDMRKTIDFALSLNSDFAEFSITIPYAGTEMYDVALGTGTIPYDFWLEYAKEPKPDFEIPYLIETGANRQQLLALRDEAIQRFYFRPKYVLKQLFKVRSLSELRRKTKMAGRLLGV